MIKNAPATTQELLQTQTQCHEVMCSGGSLLHSSVKNEKTSTYRMVF